MYLEGLIFHFRGVKYVQMKGNIKCKYFKCQFIAGNNDQSKHVLNFTCFLNLRQNYHVCKSIKIAIQ